MTNTVATRPQLNMGSLSDPAELGRMLAASKYFEDAKDAAQAAVKVLAGAELGIPPIAAMTGVFIVKGRVTLGANLIAALIKRHPKYDMRVVDLSDEQCVIEFSEGGTALGTSEFTMADAKTAGLTGDNWRKYPRNMLFARAVSNGAKWYVPDVFAGAPIYTPDELGAETDPETGALILGAVPPLEPAVEPPATVEIDGRTVDKQTGEVLPSDETPAPSPAGRQAETEAVPTEGDPGPAARQGASPLTVVGESGPDVESAPADADAPMTNTEFAKLVEYLDKIGATESFRSMSALAADVEDLAQLSKAQAREVMETAKKRFGKP